MFKLGNVDEVSESEIEKAVSGTARSYGWRARKFKSPSNRNEPDHIYFRHSKVVLIEFKRKGKRPTRAQANRLAEYRGLGFFADWCDDISEGRRIFEDIENGTIELE